MNKEKVLQVLEDDTFPIAGELHTAININQSGTLNEEKLKKEREFYLKTLTSWMAPELITKTQHYPHNDISNVEFKADFVIMQRETYDYIKQFVESLITTKELMNHDPIYDNKHKKGNSYESYRFDILDLTNKKYE